jgi:predicted phosphodiesterase
MPRYGLIADIHGNLAALEAALEALAAAGVDEILCLGDIVGYNAEPNECVDRLRALSIMAIAGNHDRIAAGLLDTGRCANKVVYALRRTRRALTPEARAFLAALPLDHVRAEAGFVLVHGGVDDVERYLRTPADIRREVERFRQRYPPGVQLCFFGHIHEQCVYEIGASGEVESYKAIGLFRLEPGKLYFVNPGAVDAARKSGSQQGIAQCAVYDSAARTVRFLEAAYDHAAAEARAQAEGYRIGPFMARLYGWRRRWRRWLERLPAAAAAR